MLFLNTSVKFEHIFADKSKFHTQVHNWYTTFISTLQSTVMTNAYLWGFYQLILSEFMEHTICISIIF